MGWTLPCPSVLTASFDFFGRHSLKVYITLAAQIALRCVWFGLGQGPLTATVLRYGRPCVLLSQHMIPSLPCIPRHQTIGLGGDKAMEWSGCRTVLRDCVRPHHMHTINVLILNGAACRRRSMLPEEVPRWGRCAAPLRQLLRLVHLSCLGETLGFDVCQRWSLVTAGW